MHLGRCFSVGASHNVLTDDTGHKLFSFVILGGQERHIFWAESDEERNAWVRDVQAVVGDHMDASLSASRSSAPKMVHDHAFWDTVLWELRSAHQTQLEDAKDGIRSSVGLVCSGTRVSKILPASPASKSLRCLHSNEEIQIEVGDEILEVNNEAVLPDSCAAMLRGDDVVGSMMRIKIKKSHAEPASPIARANDTSASRLMTPGQSPSAVTPGRSSIHAFSPYKWEGKSQLGAGEYEVDVVSVPRVNVLSFEALTQTIEQMKGLEGSGPLVATVQSHADGLMESLETYSSYADSHLKGLEDVFHGVLACGKTALCLPAVTYVCICILSVCMHVCMYVRMYLRTYVRTYVCTCVCVCVCVCVCAQARARSTQIFFCFLATCSQHSC